MVGVVALLGGCRAEPAVPLSYTAAGCSAAADVARGACGLARSSTLALWLPIGAHDPWEVSGPATRVDAQPREAGLLVRLRSSGRSGSLRLRVRGATVTRQLEIAIDAMTATITPAGARMQAGRALLRRGEPTAALAELAAAERGAPMTARRAAMLGAYVAAVMLGDHVEAERRIGRVGDDPVDGEGQALREYHRGMLWAMQGQRRDALDALERSARLARRLDLPLLDDVLQLEAIQLLELGQSREAARRLERLAAGADGWPPLARASLLNNLASARVAAGAGRDAARREFERALEDYAVSGAIAEANNARVSLALLELEDGRVEAARAALAQVEGPQLPVAVAWHRLLSARAAWEAGERPAACAQYAALAEDSRRALWSAVEARAELGVGVCEHTARRWDAAAEAFARATAALDAQLDGAPLDRSIVEHMDGRAELTQRVVELWLARGQPAAAFEAARRAHGAGLARLALARAGSRAGDRERWLVALGAYREARAALDRAVLEAWQSTTGEADLRAAEHARLRAEVQRRMRELLQDGAGGPPLPSPPAVAAGELRLLAVGARVLGGNADGVYAGRSELLSALEAADTLTVVGPTSAELLALLGARPWAHTADLTPRTPEGLAARAVVIADPRGDLPEARREGTEVAELLRAGGWSTTLYAGAAATRGAVEAALRSATLLHYAGHGEDQTARRWDASLLLADGALELADVLASATVPRWVVLSGCQTAPIGRGDLTLAEAFVLAGAAAVVATSTAVHDSAARAFAQRLYREPAGPWTLPKAYADSRGPEGVFRLVVR